MRRVGRSRASRRRRRRGRGHTGRSPGGSTVESVWSSIVDTVVQLIIVLITRGAPVSEVVAGTEC